VLNSCKKILEAKKINMVRCAAGEYLTVQEMGGFQMFLARMDDELIKLWDAPCKCPCMAK
jgi:dihydroxyacetone kinase-like protein